MWLNTFRDEYLVRVAWVHCLVEALLRPVNGSSNATHITHGRGTAVIIWNDRVNGFLHPSAFALRLWRTCHVPRGVGGIQWGNVLSFPAPGPSKVCILVLIPWVRRFAHALELGLEFRDGSLQRLDS